MLDDVHTSVLVTSALTECDCFSDGTDATRICDPVNGQCVCIEGISGARCSECEGIDHFIIENGMCIGMCLPVSFCLLNISALSLWWL